MHNLNISKNFLCLVVDYLTDRTHHVTIDDKSSCDLISGFGVPQGSILGPILFNLYAIDLSLHLKHTNSLQYADDTNIYAHAKPNDLDVVQNLLEENFRRYKLTR